jgi:hypothetical protein
VWGGGPTVVLDYTGDKIVAGIFANTIWSFGGTKGVNRYNTSLFQPFGNYNLGHGWFVYSDPVINVELAGQGDQMDCALGGGAGRIVHLGKLPSDCRSAYTATSCSRPPAADGCEIRPLITLGNDHRHAAISLASARSDQRLRRIDLLTTGRVGGL